jgi:hypothetical protein
MSEPRPRYELTLRDLRAYCRGLAKVEVEGHGSTEELVGRDAGGFAIVRVKGRVMPATVKKFRNSYQTAVAAGIIKLPPPQEMRPHAPKE